LFIPGHWFLPPRLGLSPTSPASHYIVNDKRRALRYDVFMNAPIDPRKFQNPTTTAKGERRASVFFKDLKTLWFNSGSLCNIECANCYILSSPTADHFVYLTPDDMRPYLDEIDTLYNRPVEIAFTGGEPYLNPHMIEMSEMALSRGHDLLVLTNAILLFPEMDEKVDVPEITTACWGILDVHPDSMMCATSRMVVKRKGEAQASVLACTLLWDDPQFETGKTLTESRGPVKLNHPHCAKFCVLGGASCSA